MGDGRGGGVLERLAKTILVLENVSYRSEAHEVPAQPASRRAASLVGAARTRSAAGVECMGSGALKKRWRHSALCGALMLQRLT